MYILLNCRNLWSKLDVMLLDCRNLWSKLDVILLDCWNLWITGGYVYIAIYCAMLKALAKGRSLFGEFGQAVF